MSDLKLSHIQAGFVRAFLNTDIVSYALDAMDTELTILLKPNGFYCHLSDEAVQALADYDKEHMTVNREDLHEAMTLLALHYDFPEGTSGARLMSAIKGA